MAGNYGGAVEENNQAIIRDGDGLEVNRVSNAEELDACTLLKSVTGAEYSALYEKLVADWGNPNQREVTVMRLGGGPASRLDRRPFLSETAVEEWVEEEEFDDLNEDAEAQPAEAAMNYREEIETVLNRDGKLYGKVWRGETEGLSESDISRIWKQIHVMLDQQAVKTTLAQKKRWAKRMSGFARRQCLSRLIAAEIARRAERCILGR